jgi:hypothetical protein
MSAVDFWGDPPPDPPSNLQSPEARAIFTLLASALLDSDVNPEHAYVCFRDGGWTTLDGRFRLDLLAQRIADGR